MVGHPKEKVNGKNGIGLGSGGGGGARYIQTATNYFIGNGGNGRTAAVNCRAARNYGSYALLKEAGWTGECLATYSTP